MSKNFTTIQRIKQLKNVLAILFTILTLSVGKLQAQVTVNPGVGGPSTTVSISTNTTESAAPTVLALGFYLIEAKQN